MFIIDEKQCNKFNFKLKFQRNTACSNESVKDRSPNKIWN